MILDRLDRFGEALGDGAAGDERRPDVLLLQDPQQAVDRVMGAIFALAPDLVVEDTVLSGFTSSPP